MESLPPRLRSEFAPLVPVAVKLPVPVYSKFSTLAYSAFPSERLESFVLIVSVPPLDASVICVAVLPM